MGTARRVDKPEVSVPDFRATVARRERILTASAALLLLVFQVVPDSLVVLRNGIGWVPFAASAVAVWLLWWQLNHLRATTAMLIFTTVLHVVISQSFNLTLFAVTIVITHALGARVAASWSLWGFALLTMTASAMASRASMTGGDSSAVTAAAVTGLTVTPVLLAWMVGRLSRARNQEVTAMRQVIAHAERERADAQQIAAMTERAHIAREMHDVLAHSLTGLVTRADGARYAAQREPQVAIDALAEISREGRVALADLRSLIGNLRSAVTEPAPLPGLSNLDELMTTTRRRGLDLRFVEDGEQVNLSAGQGLTVYRIVQESLTNVVKHAGIGSSAVVSLGWSADRLDVTVRNDGAGRVPSDSLAESGSGSGILGMRERVESLGGTLSATSDDTGFTVHAQLPLKDVR